MTTPARDEPRLLTFRRARPLAPHRQGASYPPPPTTPEQELYSLVSATSERTKVPCLIAVLSHNTEPSVKRMEGEQLSFSYVKNGENLERER